MNVRLLAVLALTLVSTGADEPARILRPPDKAAFRTGQISLIATAPDGALTLDGSPVEAERPFPNVLQAVVKVDPGIHKVVLSWAGGRKEAAFSVGPEVPAGFEPFRPHPPAGDVSCTQCHQVSRRGRFVFKGGCFDCHNNSGFAKTHTHTSEVLAQCGLCHNPHGSVSKSHLVLSKELACKQCHD
jgi:predicted CXXCH cytochrome family protein